MRLAIIGTGNWGRNHARVFAELIGEADVVACDLDADRLKALQDCHPGIHTVTDPGLVLADQGVAAVVIASPAVTHFTLARQALEAGKHVLVEKPLALALDEAAKLIALADRENKILMVDHLLEYHPAVEEMDLLIREGRLGEIYYLYSQRINLGVVRTEENALWSLGPHDISAFLFILEQEPVRVSARGGAYLQQGVEDVVFLDLEFADGVRAHAHLSWLDPQKVRRITVVGSKKMMVFDDMAEEKLQVFDRYATPVDKGFQVHRGDGRVISVPPEEPLRKMATHFLDCIKSNTTPRSDGRGGLRVLRVLAAAQRSLEEGGRPVELEVLDG